MSGHVLAESMASRFWAVRDWLEQSQVPYFNLSVACS
jgi:hypothetical protein